MLRIFPRFLLLLVLPAAFVLSSAAQFGVPLNRSEAGLEPAEVRERVAQYCRFDYAGARLNPEDWLKIKPLVSWPANPDYPVIVVTSRFDVAPTAVLEHGKYLVTVHYRILGKFTAGAGYAPEAPNTLQESQFSVSEINGEWRISDIQPGYPHPSRAVMLQWLKARLTDAKDDVSKTIYQQAITQLQPPSSAPVAAHP